MASRPGLGAEAKTEALPRLRGSLPIAPFHPPPKNGLPHHSRSHPMDGIPWDGGSPSIPPPQSVSPPPIPSQCPFRGGSHGIGMGFPPPFGLPHHSPPPTAHGMMGLPHTMDMEWIPPPHHSMEGHPFHGWVWEWLAPRMGIRWRWNGGWDGMVWFVGCRPKARG